MAFYRLRQREKGCITDTEENPLQVVLVASVLVCRVFLFGKHEGVTNLREQLWHSDLATIRRHTHIPDVGRGVDVLCNVGCLSLEEGEIAPELGSCQIFEDGLELVDEPGFTP